MDRAARRCASASPSPNGVARGARTKRVRGGWRSRAWRNPLDASLVGSRSCAHTDGGQPTLTAAAPWLAAMTRTCAARTAAPPPPPPREERGGRLLRTRLVWRSPLPHARPLACHPHGWWFYQTVRAVPRLTQRGATRCSVRGRARTNQMTTACSQARSDTTPSPPPRAPCISAAASCRCSPLPTRTAMQSARPPPIQTTLVVLLVTGKE